MKPYTLMQALRNIVDHHGSPNGSPKRQQGAVPIPRLRFGLPAFVPTHFEELTCTVAYRRWLTLCLVWLLSASPAFGEVIAEGFDINPHGKNPPTCLVLGKAGVTGDPPV